ncbi:hypothetical protein [Fluviicola taffensis]|uniref:Lipoprotein n=1 Tax=Fluviicola taffensis (strain DSM 16823 / NCIMB 13979 / RW262) TaxID=755732 RepID=F2IIG2_FLUTR|nr:hypothetical protein [Fluviicola taffensis]AEA44888.1 hypothetical protein Fluta_2909 [Fluviicola taffensis DSM 16823]
MKRNKLNVFWLVLIVVIQSCNSEKIPVSDSEIQLEDTIGKTRFTYSQVKTSDFQVSVGGFQVLYEYSKPIDTLSTYSGAFELGKDSVLFLRLNKIAFNEESNETNSEFIAGELEGLFIYSSKKFTPIKPPFFKPDFSSFILRGNDLYYWGFEKFEILYACKYNILTHKLIKKRIGEPIGTDYYGVYSQPEIGAGKIRFVTDGNQIDATLDLDLNLKQIFNPTDYLEF